VEELERIASRVARAVGSEQNPEQILESASLVSELANEFEAVQRRALTLLDAPEPPSAFSADSKTVLLVEPDSVERKAIRELLEELGHTVLEAEAGRGALKTCRENAGAIDVILTNIFLPDISGRELAASAAAIRPGQAVLYIAPENADDALCCGMPGGQPMIAGRPLTAYALARCLAEIFEVEYAR
jgi:CheY-like chemotaxis protein